MRAFLEVTSGSQKGLRVEINRDRFVIGRGKSANLHLNSPVLEEEHCIITKLENMYFITATKGDSVKIGENTAGEKEQVELTDDLPFSIADKFHFKFIIDRTGKSEEPSIRVKADTPALAHIWDEITCYLSKKWEIQHYRLMWIGFGLMIVGIIMLKGDDKNFMAYSIGFVLVLFIMSLSKLFLLLEILGGSFLMAYLILTYIFDRFGRALQVEDSPGSFHSVFQRLEFYILLLGLILIIYGAQKGFDALYMRRADSGDKA